MFLTFFNSNGKESGKKIPQKMNSVNASIEACGYTKITFLYQKHFFMDELNLVSHLQSFIRHNIHEQISENAKTTNSSLFETYKMYKRLFVHTEKCEELYNLSFSDFKTLTHQTINDIKNEIILLGETEFEHCNLLEETYYEIIKAKDNVFSSTGIVFVGYGNTDIYPKLTAYKISFPIKQKLRYFCESRITIDNNGNDASITPFAQTDVIETIISGISNTLLHKFLSFSQDTLNQMYHDITIELALNYDNIPQAINNLDKQKYINDLSDKLKSDINSEQVVPLLYSIGVLEKSELAEVAESLIALTSVKRKITFYTESVGGPIDVAIITRHEGFQWIKRK